MDKFLAIIKALQYGTSLADPASWKSRQNTVNGLIGLFGAISLVYHPTGISDEDFKTIASSIAIVLGLFNAYFTTSTTDKIGLPTRNKPDSEAGASPRADP